MERKREWMKEGDGESLGGEEKIGELRRRFHKEFLGVEDGGRQIVRENEGT